MAEEIIVSNRKFLLNYIDTFTETSMWEMEKIKQLNIFYAMLEKLLEYISNLNASTTSFQFSDRQKFCIEQLDLPTSEIEECFLDTLNNKPRYSRFIGDSYYNFWDYFYDYGTRKDEPINQVEKDTIIPIINKYLSVCKKLLSKI